jgi:hypothetical protein
MKVSKAVEIWLEYHTTHSNLSTTQRYLGTISDAEAIRWIENIQNAMPA